MIQIYHLWWINLNLGDQESALNHKADLCASQCWFMWFMQQTIGGTTWNKNRSNNLWPAKNNPPLQDAVSFFFWGGLFIHSLRAFDLAKMRYCACSEMGYTGGKGK